MRREKREVQEAELKKNMKNMTPAQKLEYFWMYDKWVIVAVIVVIAVTIGGYQWYQSYKTKTVLSVAAINGSMTDYDQVKQELETLLDAGSRYEDIDLLLSYTADEETGELDYYSQMGFITQTQAAMLDVVIMPKSFMELQDSDMFYSINELLSAEKAEQYAELIEGSCLVLEESILTEMFALYYEPVCVGVMVNSKNPENAAVFVQYILDESGIE